MDLNIVFTSKGKNLESKIDPRFSNCDYLVCYNEGDDRVSYFDNRVIEPMADVAKTVQEVFKFEADIIITGNVPEENAFHGLKNQAVRIVIGAEGFPLMDAYMAFKRGDLV